MDFTYLITTLMLIVCVETASKTSRHIQSAIIDKHNELRKAIMMDAEGLTYRAKDLPYLTWDNTIAANAQSWANNMSASGVSGDEYGCHIEHSAQRQRQSAEGELWGENMAWSTTGRRSLVEVFEGMIQRWWDEVNDFYYGNGTADPLRSCRMARPCGHFTQIMWPKTRKLGCGFAQCPTNKLSRSTIVFVCQYEETGNVIGGRLFEKEDEKMRSLTKPE